MLMHSPNRMGHICKTTLWWTTNSLFIYSEGFKSRNTITGNWIEIICLKQTEPSNSYYIVDGKEESFVLHCDIYKDKCDEVNSCLMQDYCKHYYKGIHRKLIGIATKATTHRTVCNYVRKLVNIATNIDQQITECRNSVHYSETKSN
jgi:hypothetical protein